MSEKIIYVCANCGSAQIFRDALVAVNDAEDVRTYDAISCEQCGDDKARIVAQDDYALLRLVQEAEAWDSRFGDSVEQDCDINGADAVEFITENAPRLRSALEITRKMLGKKGI